MEKFIGLIFLIFYMCIEVESSDISAEKVVLLDTILEDWRGWTTNTGRYSGWRSQNIPPNGDKVFGLCMVMRDNNDNWLYSPIISTGEANSIIIETFFSMRNCRNYPEPSKLKSCKEKINLLIYETDEVNESTAQNNKLFKQNSILFPEKKWSHNEQEQPIMNAHKTIYQVKTLGIQLGYRDTGSCTMIRRVRVYYLACPTVVTTFMEFPRTVTKHGYDLASSQGSCVNGAVRKNSDEFHHRICQSNGMWHDMTVDNCHCASGYTPSNDWKSCIACAKGTFKPTAGIDTCSYCPKYSQSESGQMRCRCNNEFHQKVIGFGKMFKTLCLQSPNAPEELKAHVTEGYLVTLTWKYQKSKESDVSDDIEYFHISCSNCDMDKLVVLPGVNVTQQSVTIVGLNMDRHYLFFVSSISSSLNNSITESSSIRSSVSFSLPKTNGIQMNSVKVSYTQNKSLLISLDKPVNSPVDIYMLQICLMYIFNVNITKKECEYKFVKFINFLYSPKISCTEVKFRLRFKSKNIWSDFSKETKINLLPREIITSKDKPDDQISAETYSLFLWLPNLEVILLFVTLGVLVVILLSVSVILMRKHVYRTMKQSDCTLHGDVSFIDNTKSSYASITASSPSKGRSYFYLSSTDNSVSQHWSLEEISPELIIMKSLVKKGVFYDTYTACLKQYRKLPLKVTLYVLNTNDEIKKSLLDDVQQISQFRHENLVCVIGICSINKPQILISEHMAQGSLNGFLKRYNSTIDNSQLLQFLRDIACGLCYLSERKFVIKRLTSYQVFVDDSFVCKFSIILREWNNEIQSTADSKNEIGWSSPELYSHGVHTIQSDVWAYGIVIWEVFSFGQQPYWNWNSEIIKRSVLEGYRLPPSNSCLSVINDLMLQCWSLDTSQRPTFFIILAKMDQVINYVDDKLLIPPQKTTISSDRVNQNDHIQSNIMLNSLNHNCVENLHLISDQRKNVSLSNINDNFHSLKQKKEYFLNKRSTLSHKHGSFQNIKGSTKSIDNLLIRRQSNDERLSPKSSTLQRHIKGSKVNLSNWLSEINMKKYKRVLIKNGYNDRSKLVNVSIADLTEMGIRKASEIQILISNIRQLKNIDHLRI